MTVGPLLPSPASILSRSPQQAPELAEGQQLLLQVTRRVDDRRYIAVFGSRQHLVDSAVELAVGSRVRVAVAAVGEKLELRYLRTEVLEEDETNATAPDGGGNPILTSLEERFAMSLDGRDRRALERAMDHAANPELMAASGLFLTKLAMPVVPGALEAIYESQVWSPRAAGIGVRRTTLAVDEESRELVELMTQALDADADPASNPTAVATPPPAAGGADIHADAGSSQRDDARRLLNIQDDGSVGYRFGVLPVIIGDELVELDLAYFRDRHASGESEGLRRMVMTFSTAALGRVEVAAQALSDRLSISIRTDSAVSSEALATHAHEVRDLLTRLGWNVDTVAYDFDPDTRRASNHIVEHVLNADTLSRLL